MLPIEATETSRKQMLSMDAGVRALPALGRKAMIELRLKLLSSAVLICYLNYGILVVFLISASCLHVTIWYHLFH